MIVEKKEMIALESIVPTPNNATQVSLSAEVVQQVLGFLGSFAGTGYTILVRIALFKTLKYVSYIALRKDTCYEVRVYPQQVLGSMIADGEHGLFCKFMKMNPQIFQGTKFGDGFDFLINLSSPQKKKGLN